MRKVQPLPCSGGQRNEHGWNVGLNIPGKQLSSFRMDLFALFFLLLSVMLMLFSFRSR